VVLPGHIQVEGAEPSGTGTPHLFVQEHVSASPSKAKAWRVSEIVPSAVTTLQTLLHSIITEWILNCCVVCVVCCAGLPEGGVRHG
jgi:hypothetical protein